MRKRELLLATAAIVCNLLGSFRAAWAGTSADWLNPVSGNWIDPANWSINPVFPDNGQPSSTDTYSVLIDASGAPYAVTFNSSSLATPTVVVDDITLNSTNATLLAKGGTLTALDGINVQQGTFRLFGATLSNTALNGPGQISLMSGVLDQVTLGGTATIESNGGGPLWVQDGLTLNNGTLAIKYFSAAGDYPATMGFRGNQTLGGSGQFLLQGDHNPLVYVQGGTLTVGAGVTVRGAGHIKPGNATIVNNGQFIADNPAFGIWLEV